MLLTIHIQMIITLNNPIEIIVYPSEVINHKLTASYYKHLIHRNLVRDRIAYTVLPKYMYAYINYRSHKSSEIPLFLKIT